MSVRNVFSVAVLAAAVVSSIATSGTQTTDDGDYAPGIVLPASVTNAPTYGQGTHLLEFDVSVDEDGSLDYSWLGLSLGMQAQNGGSADIELWVHADGDTHEIFATHFSVGWSSTASDVHIEEDILDLACDEATDCTLAMTLVIDNPGPNPVNVGYSFSGGAVVNGVEADLRIE